MGIIRGSVTLIFLADDFIKKKGLRVIEGCHSKVYQQKCYFEIPFTLTTMLCLFGYHEWDVTDYFLPYVYINWLYFLLLMW